MPAGPTSPCRTRRAVAALVDEVSDVAREADAVNTVGARWRPAHRSQHRHAGHRRGHPHVCAPTASATPSSWAPAVSSRAVQLALAKVGVGARHRAASFGRFDRLAGRGDRAAPTCWSTPRRSAPARMRAPCPPSCCGRTWPCSTSSTGPVPRAWCARRARSGAPAEAGAAILLGQAWRSLELWLGLPAPVEVMRAALEAELGDTSDA